MKNPNEKEARILAYLLENKEPMNPSQIAIRCNKDDDLDALEKFHVRDNLTSLEKKKYVSRRKRKNLKTGKQNSFFRIRKAGEQALGEWLFRQSGLFLVVSEIVDAD